MGVGLYMPLERMEFYYEDAKKNKEMDTMRLKMIAGNDGHDMGKFSVNLLHSREPVHLHISPRAVYYKLSAITP